MSCVSHSTVIQNVLDSPGWSAIRFLERVMLHLERQGEPTCLDNMIYANLIEDDNFRGPNHDHLHSRDARMSDNST
jgi:hypothetical protein